MRKLLFILSVGLLSCGSEVQTTEQEKWICSCSQMDSIGVYLNRELSDDFGDNTPTKDSILEMYRDAVCMYCDKGTTLDSCEQFMYNMDSIR